MTYANGCVSIYMIYMYIHVYTHNLALLCACADTCRSLHASFACTFIHTHVHLSPVCLSPSPPTDDAADKIVYATYAYMIRQGDIYLKQQIPPNPFDHSCKSPNVEQASSSYFSLEPCTRPAQEDTPMYFS